MYLEITCPSCGKKTKIRLTGAERKIAELREQLKREREKAQILKSRLAIFLAVHNG